VLLSARRPPGAGRISSLLPTAPFACQPQVCSRDLRWRRLAEARLSADTVSGSLTDREGGNSYLGGDGGGG